MRYYSLNGKSPEVNFKEAAIYGQAPDGGLYFPKSIPVLEPHFFDNLTKFSREEIAYKVMAPLVGEAIPEKELQKIIAETIQFEIPVVKIKENIFSLELFHGPTLAFKDVGARFMSRCLGYFVKETPEKFKKKITVLVATSGDTGGAVANGFYDVEGIEVVILYPSGKVSSVQEKQLTTLGKNITALEINGTFDDCQKMVKQAFADHELNNKLFLTSANSINVARWLPQQFYYFYAYQQWNEIGAPVISVPSGNFGNLCSGLVAFISGLPVKHFIAACNSNDVVPRYFATGEYHPKPAKATMSNAMDVGDPSNFVRMIELFGNDFKKLKESISAYSISEQETSDTIREVNEKFGYLPDPHGAVGYAALKKYLASQPGKRGLFLETAHPIKFYDVVEPLINRKLEIPENLAGLMARKKVSTKISTYYTEFKEFLLKSY